MEVNWGREHGRGRRRDAIAKGRRKGEVKYEN